MPSTERAYRLHIRKFLEFHRETPPERLEASNVAEYLQKLKGAPSTQRAALNALAYLYRELLRKDLRAELKAPEFSSPLPVVLSREEVKSVLTRLAGEHHLMASLLYGSGLKVSECLQLRIKDLDLQAGTILVRNVRGQKDRVTILAKSVVPALNVQLGRSRLLYEADRRLGRPPVQVPRGVAPTPSERGKQWAWQWVFPLERLPFEKARVHVPEDGLQRAVKQAVAESGIEKRASCQTLRHSFAAHLLESSYDVRIVQELLGFSDPRPVQAYMPLVERRGITVRSPLDEWSD